MNSSSSAVSHSSSKVLKHTVTIETKVCNKKGNHNACQDANNLLYMKMSGFQMLFGGSLTLEMLPYSDSFQARL